jgi:MarC family membrane protein
VAIMAGQATSRGRAKAAILGALLQHRPPRRIAAMMNYTFASATILLILITDPVGNIPIFANALKHVAPERRPKVILREILIAFALLLTFMFIGQSFLRVMNLSDLSLQIGGGVILFLIALRMVFPPPATAEGEIMTEPLIVPLAVPAIAGPSALATVLLLVSQQPDKRLEWIGALCVTMLISAVVLVSAERIQRWIGTRLVVAVERLMGLVLVSVAIEMMLRGIKTFTQQVAAGL